MFKVNNRNTRTRCEIGSKLTIKTPKRQATKPLASFWCLYCSFWYFSPCSSVSLVTFEKLNADWASSMVPPSCYYPTLHHWNITYTLVSPPLTSCLQHNTVPLLSYSHLNVIRFTLAGLPRRRVRSYLYAATHAQRILGVR